MGIFKDQMKKQLLTRGLSDRTIDIYLKAMGNFIRFFNKPPDKINADEIIQFQQHLNEKKASYSVFNQHVSAIKFFYKNVLRSNVHINRIFYTKRPKKLPVILSQDEIISIYNVITNIKHKTIFITTYACGLRVSETSKLKVEDIDSKRMMIRIRCAKGKKDRYAPLPQKLLHILRKYWNAMKQKPAIWLFPSSFYGNQEKHISIRSIQFIIQKAGVKAGIKKNISVHTLRHSYATHLMEAGVNLRKIQLILGHTSILTTVNYTHLADNYVGNFNSPIETLKI